jgi:hypothetical protein
MGWTPRYNEVICSMPHTFEPAASGRSKCRGCGRFLERGELRFGERLANPFSDGEMTLWFHPKCASYKRPEALLEGLAAASEVPDREALECAARASLAQHRLARIDGAQRAPGSQASCRSCHESIRKGDWRIRLAIFDEGRFNPAGYVHLSCAETYFAAAAGLEHLLQFSPDLSEADREALRVACPA